MMLSGCATFTADGGMSKVQTAAGDVLAQEVRRIHNDADAAEIATRVRAIIASGLSADKSVQIALLNNRGLQAVFAELAATEAAAVDAALPPSPTLSLTRLTASIAANPAFGTALEIERQILVNVLSLLTLPRRRDIAQSQFRVAQLRAAELVLRTAAATRRAYYRAVGSAHVVTFLEEAKASAEAASEVAKRLGQTGALNKLDQAREHAFYAELAAQLAAAKLQRDSDREQLTRLMGLWGRDAQFRLPTRLPELPARVRTAPEVEAEAIDKRIDLAISRAELDLLAQTYGLTRKTRFINVLEVAGIRNFEKETVVTPHPPPEEPETERTKTRWRGIELEIQVPIWDLGEARTRRAEETYLQALHHLAERAINVRSEVREAYALYRGSYDVARHYRSEILPLRKIISDETMLRYNAMVADLSALLVDARARIMTNVAAIEARRNHFLAETELHVATYGGGVSAPVAGPRTAAAAQQAGGH